MSATGQNNAFCEPRPFCSVQANSCGLQRDTGHRQSLQAPPACLSSIEQAITQRARVHHMGGLRCKDAVAVLGGQCWNEFLQPSLVNILKQDSALTAKRVGGLGACPGLALCVDIKKSLLAYQMADPRIFSKRCPSLYRRHGNASQRLGYRLHAMRSG